MLYNRCIACQYISEVLQPILKLYKIICIWYKHECMGAGIDCHLWVWLSLCKIARSSIILLFPLFTLNLNVNHQTNRILHYRQWCVYYHCLTKRKTISEVLQPILKLYKIICIWYKHECMGAGIDCHMGKRKYNYNELRTITHWK
jgi:hypothetical protein